MIDPLFYREKMFTMKEKLSLQKKTGNQLQKNNAVAENLATLAKKSFS
jgi:hypothetical protein